MTKQYSGFSDPLEYYQAIAQELVRCITESWVKVDIEAKRYESSINLKVMYYLADGTKKSLTNLIMLPNYFFDLARAVSKKEKGLYKTCKFTLNSNGSFNVDFTY